jgi:hypothetical protein
MDKEELWCILLVIVGALGLIGLAEWILLNRLTPIGEIVSVLEWMSNLGDNTTPIDLVIMVISFIMPILLLEMARKIVKEKWGI